MSTIARPETPLPPQALEQRLRSLSHDLLGDPGIDDLEVKHLLEILTRASLLLSDVYDTTTLGRVLAGESRLAALLEGVSSKTGRLPDDRRFRAWGIPDLLRTCGDKCLYDVGLAGRRSFRGVDLEDLGPRSYSLAGQVLELLSRDRLLCDFYDRNLVERLPIEEEILFLRQCASRFPIHAQILKAFRGHDVGVSSLVTPQARTAAPDGPGEGIPQVAIPAALRASEAAQSPAAPRRTPDPPDLPSREEDLERLGRVERLTRYERAILFSALDIAALRARLKEEVVDQDEAVDQLCDDLAVHALGTRARPRPQSYLFAGPTGVGKNYLAETLVRLVEQAWGIEVPFLLLEGPQYTYPSDVSELKGSTRGFIRSDEEGLLSEFHDRARKAPLSILLVDEIEKANPQLARFFLSLMDRGSTMDNKGRILHFPATILIYTSNLGYSDEQMLGRPIGYGPARRTATGRRGAATRNLKRGLPPEFLNRLRVIHFAPLSRASAERILDQEAARVAARYRALHRVELQVTEAARRALIDEGFSEEYGARHLVRHTDRVLNVEVGLRLHGPARGLTDDGRRILERIRAAREEGRALDEEALRSEVAQQVRLNQAPGSVRVDWRDGRFTYEVKRR